MIETNDYKFCFACDDWSGIGECIECNERSCVVCGCNEEFH